MNELTDREKKLIAIIMSLISALNVLSTFVQGLYHWVNWYDDVENRNHIFEFERSMMDTLKNEFGIEMNKVDPFKKEDVGNVEQR